MVEEPTASDTSLGSVFGHYRLGRLLGRSEFGDVYEALDTEKDRVVALKLIAAPFTHDQAFRQRLFSEVRTIAHLREPHIVPIHTWGEVDGQLFIDMQLIDCIDLQTVLAQEGPLPPARAVAIVRQIAAALDAAHAHRVIHRDLKPTNILLTYEDFACLSDFGLASAAAEAKMTNTAANRALAYWAPERLRGGEAGYRSDIYSLACVLYKCLTGVPPYLSTETVSPVTIVHVIATIPRPSQQRPQLPSGFDEVIARGMAENPDGRYASAGELARAAHEVLTTSDRDSADSILASARVATLEDAQVAATHPGPTPRLPPSAPTSTKRAPRRTRHRAKIALAILAALVLLVVFLTVRMHFQPSELSARPLPPSQVQLPFTGLSDPMAVAVDAAGNVYVADHKRVHELPAGSSAPVELPFTGLHGPDAVAVDNAGDVYVADYGNRRVLELPAGSTTQIELPFGGLESPDALTVDSAGNVYVADTVVLELRAGSTTPIELPFTNLKSPDGVAVDSAGNVYVADLVVWKLPAGSISPVELPFTGLNHPTGVAVDTAGNVYVTDYDVTNVIKPRVLKLPVGSATPIAVPFTGVNRPTGVAVDPSGNVYITDLVSSRVLKLPGG